jgi:hypothetical protein
MLAAGDPYMMSPAEIKALVVARHEVGSHSITHPDLTTVDDTQLATELTGSKALLESIIGEPVTNFAYPFGAYDAGVIAAAQRAGYTMARSVVDGYNSRADLETYGLRAKNILSTTTIADFRGWVDYAKAHNYWLTIVYHEVVPDGSPVCADDTTPAPCLGPFDTTVSNFTAQLEYLAASGLSADVLTAKAAMAEVRSELHGPTAGTVALEPSTLQTDSKVTAKAEGFHDPDDTVTLHYEWTADGVVLSDATSPTLALGAYPHAHAIGVAVYADDGHGNTSSKVAASAPVVNRAPGAGTVALTPPSALPGTALTATVGGFGDPDGDSVSFSYSWYRNGTALGTTGALLGTLGMTGGDVIRVDVRATDAFGGVSPVGSAEARLVATTRQPAISIRSPRARAYRRGSRTRLRFSARDASGVKRITASLRRSGDRIKTVRANTLVRLTRTGRYTLRVQATDRAGNVGVKSVTFRVVR